MSFLIAIVSLHLWERWYLGHALSVATPFRRAAHRRRARHALALNPAEFDARVDLAREAVERKKFREAQELLIPIMPRADGASEIFRLYGEALLGVGLAAEAEGAFADALKGDARQTEARLGLARSLFVQGRFDEALTAIQAYRVSRPGDARGSWAEAAMLGATGPRTGRSAQDALTELVREQRLKPGYVRRRDRTWAIRARTALLLGRIPKSPF
ncbi:MAG: tetratricopeptide repeat protein [Thermoanaerobaculia bacterium]